MVYKQKKNQGYKGNRLLISVSVLGSSGPIRFVVNEGELVGSVTDIVLKSYAREGRLPVLGSDLNEFLLYSPSVGSDGKFIEITLEFYCFFISNFSLGFVYFWIFWHEL